MTTRPVSVSVAVATRDRPHALTRLLDAIESGSQLPAEVVVADQSTDDATARLLRDRNGGPIPLRYIRVPGRGLGACQNAAFARAGSTVIAVTDDDCVPRDDWMQTIVDAFTADPELGCLTGRVLPLPDSDSSLVPVATRMSHQPREFRGRSLPWDVGSGNNFAATSEWLRAVGGNDEQLGPGSIGQGGVDMDLFYRLLRSGARMRYEPRCVVHHAMATPDARLARRAPYGYGMAAGLAMSIRERDAYAAWALGRWLASRARRLAGGAFRGDGTLVHEELLVLGGTLRGTVFGLRTRRRRRGADACQTQRPETSTDV